MKQIVWSQEMRRELYSRLKKEIGPHRTWDAKIKPIRKRSQYDNLVDALANHLSNKAGRVIDTTAVQQQINWATTTQRAMRDRSHIRSFILNKAAALEVNFISSSELPEFMTVSN